MNQELHFLQRSFVTVGAVFVDELSVEVALGGAGLPKERSFVYTFKAEPEANLQVGDFALVHACDALKIVRVVEVHDSPQIDLNARFQYKWVVQKVDLTAYRARLEEERRLEGLLSQLVFAERRLQLLGRLKVVASQDDEFAQFVQDKLSLGLYLDDSPL